MIQNPQTRRHVALALLATGAVLFLIAPENAAISLVFAGLGVLLEVLGIRLGHSDDRS
jgi:energy-converting hydrogenase Eha subunit G